MPDRTAEADAADQAEPRQARPSGPRRAISRIYRTMLVGLAWLSWLGVIGIVTFLVATWLVPVDFATDDPLQMRLNALAFYGRVFQYHLGLALLPALAVGILSWRPTLAATAGVAAAAVLGAELWRALPSASPPPATGPSLRVAAINCYFFNTNVAAIEAWIRRVEPDVVVFCEFSNLHAPLFASLSDVLPHGRRAGAPTQVAGQFAIMADRPIAVGDVFDNRREFTVDFAGEPLLIGAIHHHSPGSLYSLHRNLAATNDLLASLPDREGEAVFLGDFNASVWTPPISRLRGSGLSEAFDQSRFGRGGTWPSRTRHSPRWTPLIRKLGLAIRIDHVFVTPGLVAVDAGVGDHVGSDHRPVWAELRRVDAEP